LLQYLAVAVLAIFGFHFFSWPGAALVVVAWFALSYIYRNRQSQSSTAAAVQVISKPLSESEKQVWSDMQDRDHRMSDREAAKKNIRARR